MTEVLSVDSFYKEGRENNRLLGLVCEKEHLTVPPRHSCRICGSTLLRVKVLSGTGIVTASSKVYAKSKAFPLEAPYSLALVQLNEGGYLLGIAEADDAARIGSTVKVFFKAAGDNSEWPRIFFKKLL
jgi:uncharacterized OB-fold protein